MFGTVLINHNDMVYSFDSFTYDNVLSKYDILIIANAAIEKLKEMDFGIEQTKDRNIYIVSNFGVAEFKYQNGSLFINFNYNPITKEFEMTDPPQLDDVKTQFLKIHQKERISQFRCIDMMSKLTGLDSSNIFNLIGI